MNEAIISLFIIVYGFLATIFTFGLCFYHSTLIKSNQTTKEELKNHFRNNFGNPYDTGTKNNIKYIFFPRMSNYSMLDMIRHNYGKEKMPHVRFFFIQYIIQEEIKMKDIDVKFEEKHTDPFENKGIIDSDNTNAIENNKQPSQSIYDRIEQADTIDKKSRFIPRKRKDNQNEVNSSDIYLEENKVSCQTPKLGSILESSIHKTSLEEFSSNSLPRPVPNSRYLEQNKSIAELNAITNINEVNINIS